MIIAGNESGLKAERSGNKGLDGEFAVKFRAGTLPEYTLNLPPEEANADA
jgi:hypothetical protein